MHEAPLPPRLTIRSLLLLRPPQEQIAPGGTLQMASMVPATTMKSVRATAQAHAGTWRCASGSTSTTCTAAANGKAW